MKTLGMFAMIVKCCRAPTLSADQFERAFYYVLMANLVCMRTGVKLRLRQTACTALEHVRENWRTYLI